MASYKEIIALGRDPVRVRAVARRLLASAEDWTDWERDFLEGLVAEYGSEALSAPQREKLAELRHGAEYVSKVEELDVASLIEKCWPLRLDLDYEDDIAFIEQERGSSSIKRRHVERLFRALRQHLDANQAGERRQPDAVVRQAHGCSARAQLVCGRRRDHAI